MGDLTACGAIHFKDYLAGQLDLGVLGKVQIAMFQNPSRQNEQSTDATIQLFGFFRIMSTCDYQDYSIILQLMMSEEE